MDLGWCLQTDLFWEGGKVKFWKCGLELTVGRYGWWY